MKKATQVLKSEHRLITLAADCLTHIADAEREPGEPCILSAIELLEFFEDFVDAAHQEKEERHLFPALIECGLAKRLVAELLEDHRTDAALMAEMRLNAEGAAYGDPLSSDAFLSFASKYATLQRDHAEEEERCLLPLAEELLDASWEPKLLAGFRAVDAALPRPREHYVTLVHRVAADIPRQALFSTSPGIPRQTVFSTSLLVDTVRSPSTECAYST